MKTASLYVIADQSGAMCLRSSANAVGMCPTAFNQMLQDWDWVTGKQANQPQITQGLLVVNKIRSQTLVTAKGLAKIKKNLRSECPLERDGEPLPETWCGFCDPVDCPQPME